MNKNSSITYAAVCRWTARLLGSMLVLIILLIAIGERIPNLFTQPVRVQLGFLALALILLGILAGWRWELPGGIISLFGWGLFVAATIGSLARLNWFVTALVLPGMLYLSAALLSRRHQEQVPKR